MKGWKGWKRVSTAKRVSRRWTRPFGVNSRLSKPAWIQAFLYNIFAVLLLLNMLIAMMASARDATSPSLGLSARTG